MNEFKFDQIERATDTEDADAVTVALGMLACIVKEQGELIVKLQEEIKTLKELVQDAIDDPHENPYILSGDELKRAVNRLQ